jgi:hypothetical protein
MRVKDEKREQNLPPKPNFKPVKKSKKVKIIE